MTAMGILQNIDFLYISNKYDVLPENIEPKMSSRYPDADEGEDGERGGDDDDGCDIWCILNELNIISEYIRKTFQLYTG